MENIKLIIQIVIAIGIFNVWLLNFKKPSKYRGGNSQNMTEEFTNTKYQNLSYNQHVRLRTGMYLGSKEITENTIWIINKETKLLEKKILKRKITKRSE